MTCNCTLQLSDLRLPPRCKRDIRYLVNKTNGCTEFQFYWYYDSTCFGQSFCLSSGVLSRTSALVQFMQFVDRVLPCATEFHPASCNARSPNCINCTNVVVRLRIPERLPETCRAVIPIILELSASVGFIHKESVTMHGHTVLKEIFALLGCYVA
jgi:hypothetical protein